MGRNVFCELSLTLGIQRDSGLLYNKINPVLCPGQAHSAVSLWKDFTALNIHKLSIFFTSFSVEICQSPNTMLFDLLCLECLTLTWATLET